jgi:hypothetical protein
MRNLRLLLACESFGPRLPAAVVAGAISRGLQDGGMPQPDVCTLRPPQDDRSDVREMLDAMGFDERMRSSRAVVIGAAQLHERTLAGSAAFEIATRARQGGVPAYAVTRESTLEPFDARILDLQMIFQARSRRALLATGLELSRLA